MTGSINAGRGEAEEDERCQIEEQEIDSFDRGEGVFLTEESWVWGRFPLSEELSEQAQAHLSGEITQTESQRDRRGVLLGAPGFSGRSLAIGSETTPVRSVSRSVGSLRTRSRVGHA